MEQAARLAQAAEERAVEAQEKPTVVDKGYKDEAPSNALEGLRR